MVDLMPAKHLYASDELRHYSAMLLAYAKVLRQAAVADRLEARRIAANIARLPSPKSFSDYDPKSGGFCRCA